MLQWIFYIEQPIYDFLYFFNVFLCFSNYVYNLLVRHITCFNSIYIEYTTLSEFTGHGYKRMSDYFQNIKGVRYKMVETKLTWYNKLLANIL